jgi:outer membrane protein TolC
MRFSTFFPRAVLSAAYALVGASFLCAEPRRLDEDAAVELALRADVSAAVQRLDLEAKERKAAASYNVFLPSLTGSAIGRDSFAEAKGGGLESTGSVALRAASSLTLSAAALQSGRTAAADVSVSRVQTRAAAEKVEKETRKAFYRLLLLREQRMVAESAVEIARGSRDRTAEEYRNGLASERTRRQAEIAYETERLALARRQAEYDTARSAFSARIGLRDDEWDVAGGLDLAPVDLSRFALGPQDLLSRADLALAAAQIAVQESKVEEERRALRVPTLSLAGQYDWTKSGDGDFTPTASLSVTLSSPNLSAFLPFSDKAVSLDASLGTLRKLRLQADEAARNAALEVESLLRSLAVSASAAASLSASVELAREVVKLTREAYDVGAASYQDLRTAEKDADAARVALLSERYTYLSSLIDLEYATGKQLRPKKERS